MWHSSSHLNNDFDTNGFGFSRDDIAHSYRIILKRNIAEDPFQSIDRKNWRINEDCS